MRYLLLISLSCILLACGSAPTVNAPVVDVRLEYAKEIDTSDLMEHVYLLSSDILEGRKTGERGQKMAVNYLSAYYEHIGLSAPAAYPEYRQVIPKEYMNNSVDKDGDNVIAYIVGSDYPDEVLVISAHFDHLGKIKDSIYNGADDNASGTSALMEIAEAFQKAAKKGYGPKRSILFLHVSGEENGLFGSSYYVNNPVFKLDNTVANLNVDMIGRIDKKHENKPEYIYLIGSDRLSKDLHRVSESVNSAYTNLELDYTFNRDNDPNRYYFRSDHYNFVLKGVPVIFYFNGEHEDYHQPSDEAEKINFELLAKRSQLIFYTAWEIANRDERILVDPQAR